MIRDCDLVAKESSNHLSPARVWFSGLIADGRIAEQEDRRDSYFFDPQGSDCRPRSVELECEFFIPRPLLTRAFAILQFHFATGRYDRRANVDDKIPSYKLT